MLSIGIAILWCVVIGCLAWLLAQPFLPPAPKIKDAFDATETAVAVTLIPGVIHSLIASLLFLLAAISMAWMSGQRQLRHYAAQAVAQPDHRPTWVTVQRGALRLGLGDRALGAPWLVLALAMLIVGYAGFLSYLQYSNIDDFFGAVFKASPGWRAAAFLVFGLLAPIAEELMFRGWLWTALRPFWPSFTCTLVTGIGWILTHAPEGLVKMAILMPVALLLGLARSESASIRAPILLHLALNITSLTTPVLLQSSTLG